MHPDKTAAPDVEHSAPLPIMSRRLVLRDFIVEDWADVHALRADSAVARFMDFNPETPEQSREWLARVIVHNRERPRLAYNLAIVRRADDRVIGWIGIGPSSRHPQVGELGFGSMLHRAAWGQGYAPEAVQAIVDFGFRTLGGQRLSAWCYVANGASARVLEKAGLRFVRRYQDTEPKSGQLIDCLEYALRIDEWRARTAQEE